MIARPGIAFQPNYRLAAGNVSNFDAVEQIGNSPSRYEFGNRILGDCARPSLAGASDKHPLHRVPHDFTSDTARPADCRAIKAFALPPLGIASGGVHGRLK